MTGNQINQSLPLRDGPLNVQDVNFNDNKGILYHLNLTAFMNVTKLSLKNVGLDILHLNIFEGMTKLETLNLGNNPISDVTPLATNTQLSHVQQIKLYTNQITDLDMSIFASQSLPALEALYLYNDQISSLTT